VEVPAATPVTVPAVVIVATAVVPLLQVPPVLSSVRPSVAPAQTGADPEMGEGVAFTVTIEVTEHPVLSAYVIIEVPEDTPVTTPLLLITVATDVLPLAQVPPVVRSPSVIVEATHTGVEPVIATGVILTVTMAVTEQPVPNE